MSKEQKKELEPMAIYMFESPKILYGAARVIIDGESFIYGYSFKKVKDKESALNTPAAIRRRAWRSVHAQLSNLLNAINLYGSSVLDAEGNVDWKKYQEAEYKAAKKAVESSKTLDKEKFLHTFKVYDITMEIAQEHNLV